MQKEKIRKYLLWPFLFIFMLLFGINAQALTLKDAFSTSNNSASDPLDTVAGNAGYNIRSGSDAATPEAIIALVISIVLQILGVIFVVLMVYGGYLWMTAMGKEQQVTKAKDLFIAAIIGLIIIISAYAISYFITKNFIDPNVSPVTSNR